jgi:hypothetical protein
MIIVLVILTDNQSFYVKICLFIPEKRDFSVPDRIFSNFDNQE